MSRLHKHKAVPSIMKKALRYHVGASLLIGGLAPMAASAFVDERTPPAPPAPVVQAAPAAPVREPVPLPAVEPAPVSDVAPVAQGLQHGVAGDLSSPAWATPYPGPYGKMPLADALIAQVVPVVGKAIELNGAPELLNKRVTLIKGASRIETLRAMATTEKLGVMIQGNLVSLAGADTPRLPAAQISTSLPSNMAHLPTELVPVTKPWHLAAGSMLSTSMLDWANKWGWKLIWKADVDYRIAADINIEADFLDGVGRVLDAYKTGDRPLWGDWNDEQKVLVIREPSSRDR